MPEVGEKIKGFFRGQYFEDLAIVLAILLVGIFSFGAGRLSVLREEKRPITVDRTALTGETASLQDLNDFEAKSKASLSETSTGGVGAPFVASRNGKRYYPKDCAAAKRISAANLVGFQTVEEAEQQGFTPAANCP